MTARPAPSDAELEAFAGTVDKAVRDVVTDLLLQQITGRWKHCQADATSAALSGAVGAVAALYQHLADPKQPLPKVRDTLVKGIDEFFDQAAAMRRGGPLQ